MDEQVYVRMRLKCLTKEDISITHHAKERALSRGITPDTIKDNLLYPERLSFAGRQEAERLGEEKFDCFFAYGLTKCHRYVIVLHTTCEVCTVISITRQWKEMIRRYDKK